jgi:hypothetical protein
MLLFMAFITQAHESITRIFPWLLTLLVTDMVRVKRLVLGATILAGPVLPLEHFKPKLLPPRILQFLVVCHSKTESPPTLRKLERPGHERAT